MIESAARILLSTQNPDGGWGSKSGKRSQTEATSFAVLALIGLKSQAYESSIGRGIDWLVARQKKDGSWPVSATVDQSSWSSANAILTLSQIENQRDAALRGAEWLLRQEGRGSLPWHRRLILWALGVESEHVGWPWTDGSFSWIEPTSYSLIALKKLKSKLRSERVVERIRKGESVIYNRMCQDGGWNYGNSNALGGPLPPYPDITAVALIALQDHAATDANRSSLRSLAKMLDGVHSGLALSWSILCFSVYDIDVTASRKLLADRFVRTKFLGETKSIALSLLALSDGADVFRI